jgi:two-component system, OmpR family, alkaline phosphatase synthesis response regulator PhoP
MGKKIGIVDDEAHIRTLIEQTLEDLEDDFDVELMSAANGGEGLELIRTEKPDLVFLDVMMPIMNGYEVTKAVRKDPALSAVTIVLLTAKGQEADKRDGLDAGAARYVTKPFDPDELLHIAVEILELD